MPSTRPAFTICIPAYNAERHLEECLLSIRSQTYADYEAIVVDDGSNDKTLEICQSFKEKDPRFRVLSTINQGPLLARREAVLASSGEYLLFLDADDRLAPSALAECQNEIKKTSADVLFFHYSTEPDFSNVRKSVPPSIWRNHHPSKCTVEKETLRGELNQLCFKAVRRDLFDFNSDYSACKGFKHGEDLFQLLPLVHKASSFSCIDKCLYYYRRSADSGTFHFSPNQFNDIKRLEERLLLYGNKWGMELDASLGLATQYCYLIKILVKDASLDRARKKHFYLEICERITPLCDSSLLKKASIPWRVFLFAAKNNFYNTNAFLIHLEGLLQSK